MPWREAIRELVDEYRGRCLWFLADDYYPESPEEAERVLRYVEQYGDLDGFKRAARIRPWLSLHSSEASVVS